MDDLSGDNRFVRGQLSSALPAAGDGWSFPRFLPHSEWPGLYQALLSEFPGCVVRVDRFGKVVGWDCGRQSFFDFRGNEWIGKSLDRLFSSLDAARIRSRLEHIARGEGDGDPLEVQGVSLDGVSEPLSLRFLTSKETDAPGIVVLIQRAVPESIEQAGDADSHQQIERRLKRRALELVRSNAELRRFAYVASHDMKEPLRMVSMYVQLLRKQHGESLSAPARDLIQGAVDSISRIYTLIDALLEYSQAGRDQVPSVPVSIREVVDDALENLRLTIQESGAAIKLGTLPTLQGSRPALVRLFQNLVGNALKFSKGRTPRITIQSQAAGPHWVIAVADNGIGISPEFSEKVFEIFQRLHAPHEYPGSGIGLAVCKKIVEQHGGRIWFESNPGEGTTFFFSLLESHSDPALVPNIPWELI